ncbi:MAG: hypothetical protein KBA06_05665 [Saprospiraceae bacterium]|nr:hypothetical protein [Saprospiraceae bacterium]
MIKKPKLMLIGFIFFTLGLLSLVLSIVGVRFMFLSFMDVFGQKFSFLLKLLMMFFGIFLVSISTIDNTKEDERSKNN